MRKKRLRLFLQIGLLLLGLSLTYACFQSNRAAEGDEANASEENGFEVEPPNIDLSRPLQISQRPEDLALAGRIDQMIEKSPLSNARWGVFVVSLKDGRVLVARDARRLFNPASIQKVLTSVVALDKLGPDFRWKTRIFSQNQIGSDGTLSGDLTLFGGGAPDFGTEELNDLVNQLQAKGLKRIKGNIVGDESYFRGDDLGDGWTWNDIQWHYGAEAAALTFRENQASIFINDEGTLTSTTDFLRVRNDLKPKNPDEKDSYGIKRGLADNEVYVWGNGAKAAGQLAVHNPALWAAGSLKEALEGKGIAVEGRTLSADWKAENRLDPDAATELASVESKTLAEIVRRMNKNSVNIYAELILRTLGKKFGDTAPDPNKAFQAVRGDDSAGAAVIKKFLTGAGVATGEIEIRDGSGLSRLDFVTPEAFGRALIYAAQSKFANVFENSLPVAGTDGTLGGRLGRVKGSILAKTGSITYVSSLAGYARSKDETLAFVVICNNATRRTETTRVIDEIAAGLITEPAEDSSEDGNSAKNSAPGAGEDSSQKKTHKEKKPE
ncbi:MAG: D-alanyl-D-alanine carboxypeptidase/D-alanyl-D-alanine-endopeptidase [Pyrinomonadaceae bacterium]